MENENTFLATCLIGILGSVCVSFLILVTLPWHKSFTSDSQNKVQGMHSSVTPRVGGLAIIAGLCVVLFWNNSEPNNLVWAIVLSSLPVFFAGFAEDIGIGSSPVIRLLAAILSACITIWLTNVWLTSVGVPAFDRAMAWLPFGIFCTLLAASTMTHAYNLSDGLNGLSSGLGVISILGIFKFSQNAGDAELMLASLMLASPIIGFWLLNFLTGRIFLGDGGAYMIGHCVAWLSILLSVRNPEISPWAILLNTLLPVVDTVMAILRRMGSNLRVDQPDRCHFHHRIFYLVSRLCGHKVGLLVKNSLASSFVLTIAVLLSLLALANATSGAYVALICLIVSALVIATSIYLGKIFY